MSDLVRILGRSFHGMARAVFVCPSVILDYCVSLAKKSAQYLVLPKHLLPTLASLLHFWLGLQSRQVSSTLFPQLVNI